MKNGNQGLQSSASGHSLVTSYQSEGTQKRTGSELFVSRGQDGGIFAAKLIRFVKKRSLFTF